jgi:hypothetical protein
MPAFCPSQLLSILRELGRPTQSSQHLHWGRR